MSVINGQMALPSLSVDEAAGVLGIQEEMHTHSGRYIRERNPRLYASIVMMLGYGIPVEVISSNVGIGENTVRAIEFEQSKSVEDHRRSLLNNLRKFQHGAWSVLAENYDKIPLDKLGVLATMSHDKLAAAEGQPTQIHEHRVTVTSQPSDYEVILRERFIALQMGCVRENPLLCEGALPDSVSPEGVVTVEAEIVGSGGDVPLP